MHFKNSSKLVKINLNEPDYNYGNCTGMLVFYFLYSAGNSMYFYLEEEKIGVRKIAARIIKW